MLREAWKQEEMCADGLGHISPVCSPPPLIRLYYTYSRGLGASTASSDRLLPKRQGLAKFPPDRSITWLLSNDSILGKLLSGIPSLWKAGIKE